MLNIILPDGASVDVTTADSYNGPDQKMGICVNTDANFIRVDSGEWLRCWTRSTVKLKTTIESISSKEELLEFYALGEL